MIEVKDLVKTYGGHTALDHVSFTLEKGKIYGLLGPNGAGKSTTMNIMTGYLGATEGQVIINGYDILKEPERAKRFIGYLPEQPPVYMDMKVYEYLQFASELKKIKTNEVEREVEKVIELTKLEDVQERLIRNLSKGYRQRVGLAQAILGSPEIIILDEPTVGLDPKQIIEIRELVRNLAKEHTVVLSSHILAEISEVCDIVMIISKGKLVASDTPQNLEKMLTGEEAIEIIAKADSAEVTNILSNVAGIEKFEIEEKEDQTTFVAIRAESDQDIREALFFAFADAKKALLYMNHTSISLEEVFLELTQNEKAEEVEKEDDNDESSL